MEKYLILAILRYLDTIYWMFRLWHLHLTIDLKNLIDVKNTLFDNHCATDMLLILLKLVHLP